MVTVRHGLFACVGIGALLSGARPSAAQTAPSTSVTVADVVVTAERRETSVQSTPIAITALTSKVLERANVDTVERLVQLAPSIHYNDTIGEAFLSIRSVGGEPNVAVGGDPSVSFNVDGVYIARPTSVSSILFDVERIEVLRGPQGTLYGRNSTGGAINVITKAPNFTDFGGTADVVFGNYDARRARAAINIPLITDRVALRVSGVTDSHNGYEKNLFYPNGSADLDDLNVQAFRGVLGLRFTDQVDLTLRADTTSRGGRGPGLQIQGPYGQYHAALPFSITGPPPFGYGAPPNPDIPLVTEQDLVTSLKVKETGESGELHWHGLGGAGLTVIAAHRDLDYNYLQDLDFTAARMSSSRALQHSTQDSVEARLASESSGRLTWLVGAYYFHETGYSDVPTNIFLPSGSVLVFQDPRLDIKSRSEALFAQATYALSDRLKLTGGLRYTWDHKDAVQYTRVGLSPNILALNLVTPSSHSWSAPTGKVTLDYTLNPDTLLYGTISRGYKAGGYSITGPAFNPETIWAYEAGLKTRLFDRRLQLDFSAFYYDQKNLQIVQTAFDPKVGPELVTTNAGAATTEGVEVEFQATPVRDLQLRGSVAYLHARYDQYRDNDPLNPGLGIPPFGLQNLDGRTAVYAPDLTVSFDASYRFDLGTLGSLEPGASFYWADQQVLRVFALPADLQPAYDTVDLRLLYRPPTGSWSIEAFVDNAGDTKFKQSSAANSLIGSVTVGYGPPRTYGMKVSVDF
jgi:iron complex outermembrane receptor protein